MPYSSVYQRLAYGQWIACESLLFLERHLSQEPVSFFSAKERGFWGTARQEEVGKDPANYRGNASRIRSHLQLGTPSQWMLSRMTPEMGAPAMFATAFAAMKEAIVWPRSRRRNQ